MAISSYIVNHLSHESMVDAKNNQKSIKKANTFFIRKFMYKKWQLGLGAFGLFSEFQFSFQEIERADLKEQMGVESSVPICLAIKCMMK